MVYVCVLLFSFSSSRETKVLSAFAAPLFTCAFLTVFAAWGAACLWRGTSWLLGLVAAIPYLIVIGMLLFESRTDGVLFWTSAGFFTFLCYIGAVSLVRFCHRKTIT